MTALGCLIPMTMIFSLLASWHGYRMYKIGVRHGRTQERSDSRRARRRIISDAECIATIAYVDAYVDQQLGRGR